MNLTIYTDGGARGNPGPAAIGIFILQGDTAFWEHSQYIGETTNNVAEYTAIQMALEHLVTESVSLKSLTCKLDSELVVKQLRGEYKIKQAHLLPFRQRIQTSIQELRARGLREIHFVHVPRKENAQADRLVNQALDAQKPETRNWKL